MKARATNVQAPAWAPRGIMMPLDMVEPIILTITTEDKSSRKDEIVLQYNPDGEEKLEKLTENHDKHDYVTVDV